MSEFFINMYEGDNTTSYAKVHSDCICYGDDCNMCYSCQSCDMCYQCDSCDNAGY